MATNLEKIIEEWDNDALVIREGELPHHLLKTLAVTLDNLEKDIDDVYDTRFIQTATDHHLEKIGEQVDVKRVNQQPDDELRIRINAGYARAVSDTSFETFSRVVLNIFDVDENDVHLRGADDEPVVIVNLPLQSINESPLTDSQIADELTESTPASDGVKVEGVGTFELSGPNHTPSDNSGLDEGTLGYTFQT